MGVPEGWKSAHLDELVREPIRNGYSPRCPDEPNGRWVLSLSAVTPNGFDPQGCKPAPPGDEKVEKFRLLPGDIVLSRSNTRERVGLAGVYRGTPEWCAHSDLLMRIRLDPDSAEIDFMGQYLLSPAARDYLTSSARGTSGSMLKLNRSLVERLPVPLPPLPEQRKIAAILSSVDEAIEATQAVIDQVQVVKKGLMQELLTKGLPGRHKKFKQTEIGRIPEAWEVALVGELGEVKAGKAKNKNGAGAARPYLRVANVFDGYIDTSDVLQMPFTDSEFAQYTLRDGDILLNEGQSLELVGRCSMYRGEYPGSCAIQNALIRFRGNGRFRNGYAEQLFRKFQKDGTFASIATQTTSIAHLGVKRLANLRIAVPPVDEQREIERRLLVIDARLAAESEAAAALGNLKRALMSVLLTGELRVQPEATT